MINNRKKQYFQYRTFYSYGFYFRKALLTLSLRSILAKISLSDSLRFFLLASLNSLKLNTKTTKEFSARFK